MKNSLEILQNIMKPYFDKKAEIENKPAELENDKSIQLDKIKEMRQERINRRKELEIELEELESKIEELKNDREEKIKSLKIELENLKVRTKISIDDFNERKEREIEEYITKTMDSNRNLSAVYGSFVRKDLEKQYDTRLKDLEAKFKQTEEELTEQVNELEIQTDFENELKEEKARLLKEIKSLKSVSEEEKEEKQNLENLDNRTDFRRVDLRELVDIKENIRKQLFVEQKRLNNELNRLQIEQRIYITSLPMELEKQQLEFNEIMYKLSNFKYEYNDQHQVINGNEWRKLYEESNKISDRIYELKQKIAEGITDSEEILNVREALANIDKYLEMTNLTEEEIKVVMMSMTPWEKAEYDRRKALSNSELIGLDSDEDEFEEIKIDELPEDELEEKEDLEELDKILDKIVENDDEILGVEENKDIVEINDPVESNYTEAENDIVVENELDLLQTVYNDIVKQTMALKSVRISQSKHNLKENEYYISAKQGDEDYKVSGLVNLATEDKSLKLPCGEYVDLAEMKQALKNYYKKSKARTYFVKQAEKSYEITKGTLSKLKKALKKCSAIELFKENKLPGLDMFRVYGKEKSDEIIREAEIGKMKAENFSEGEFINRNEFIISMKNLFTAKKQTWLRSLSDSLKAKREELLDKMKETKESIVAESLMDSKYEKEEENVKQR